MSKAWINQLRIIAVSLLLLAGLHAQQPEMSPLAANPVIDVKGKILRVNLGGQQSTPYAEVDSGGKPVKVYLGSMR